MSQRPVVYSSVFIEEGMRLEARVTGLPIADQECLSIKIGSSNISLFFSSMDQVDRFMRVLRKAFKESKTR